MKPSGNLCETIYLGWDAPLLSQCVQFLLEQHGQEGCLDLSNLVCVLPTDRSLHRLQSLLRRAAQKSELEYWPPEIVTSGRLAEHLYKPAKRLATEFEQTLAWSEVLRATNSDDLAPLLPKLPDIDLPSAWMELGATLRRLHSELSASRLSFVDVTQSAETEGEQRRWRLLERLYADYTNVINGAGLLDIHQARKSAVHESSCSVDREIILVGTSDLNDVLIDMLRCVREKVTALVAAPKSEAFRFDEFGVVNTDAWLKHELPFRDDQFISAGGVSDQAIAVAETLADFGEEFSADQVTVGVTDESQVGPVELELRGCGVSTYRHLGWTISETAIGRLFSLTAAHLQRGTWQTMAALVRHADVYDYIDQRVGAESKDNPGIRTNWIVDLDQLLSNHFPLRASDPLAPAAAAQFPTAAFVAETVRDLLKPFGGPVESNQRNPSKSRTKTIAKWSDATLAWLNLIYAAAENDDQETTRTHKALGVARSLLGRLKKLNDQLDVSVSGSAALEMIADRLGELRVQDSAVAEDVELLGWLDLALDDAAAMVVVGLNHPFVPASVTCDPFLPGSLRSQLRMADNDRRYARDIYAMQLLLSTRKNTRFIIGKTAADGSSTPPSRLIAAAPAADTAGRIRHLLNDKRASVHIAHQWDSDNERSNLPVPVIDGLGKEIRKLSVTSFSSYLICPYRFYLRNVLKLRPLDDATGELAANQFGDLVHGALENFGRSPDKSLTDPDRILAAMLEHLHDYATEHYGSRSATAVQVQVRQAEQRLKAVASHQAERINDGWVIHEAEASVEEIDTPTSKAASITVDGKKMGIRGRFDRIDHHPETNRWAILDYKTHGVVPEKKHLKRKDGQETWVDLQLPLYRMLIPYLGITADPEDVDLGYFNISQKDEETRINIAHFTPTQIEAAEELICQVIRDIWAGRFEPTSERVLYDDYESILQMRVPQRLLNQEEQSVSLSLEEVV